MDAEARKERRRAIFDYIVLLGMMANIILAVFMVLYYFDFL
jgi:hypothetical protein